MNGPERGDIASNDTKLVSMNRGVASQVGQIFRTMPRWRPPKFLGGAMTLVLAFLPLGGMKEGHGNVSIEQWKWAWRRGKCSKHFSSTLTRFLIKHQNYMEGENIRDHGYSVLTPLSSFVHTSPSLNIS